MKKIMQIALASIALAVPITGRAQIFDTMLNPPVPPGDDVMKTLDVIEPRIPIGTNTTLGVNSSTTYEITKPGSYYLTENLMGESPETGLVVYVSDVTVDLNGFSLIGSTNASPNNAPGIYVETNANSVVIQDGSVVLWQNGIIGRGINLTVRNVHCRDNGFDGLRAGDLTQVYDSSFIFNLGEGVELGRNSRVEGVLSSTNSYGIVVGAGSLVRDCVTRDNVNHGIRLAGPGSRVVECVTFKNNKGISIDADRCTVERCTSTNNKSEGIACGEIATTFYTHCRIDGNHVADNQARGIVVTGTDNLIVRNVAYDNGFAYSIGASNQVGTIVTGIDATGFTGSTGGNLDATIGPWSNFAR